jgi:hypothetical protein
MALWPVRDRRVPTNWMKIKNPAYSQFEGRREVFEIRSDLRPHSRRRSRPPTLRLRMPGRFDDTILTRR